jgi:YHS domain-containing protein
MPTDTPERKGTIMDTTNELERRIQEKLALREERRSLRNNHTQRLMNEFDDRMKHYGIVADGLMDTVIRPRMEQLKRCIETLNAPQSEATRHTCKLLFKHTSAFPATATIELGVTHDGQYKTILVQYDASIVPLFFRFDGKNQLSMSLEEVDQTRASAWIEEKLLQFVDAYLSLETTSQYQTDNTATDPVCGMSVNRADAPAQMDYQGTTYFFCIDECRNKFAENPRRYLPSGKTTASRV